MPGIPSELYNPLCEALLDCGPFGDDRQIRDIFVHSKLQPFQRGLPQATDPAARARAVIAYLSERYRADTKENALVFLLRVLSEGIDAADECHARLAELADALGYWLQRGSLPYLPVYVKPLSRLRQLITRHLNDSELRTLCFDLEVDYDSLLGEGKADKARELIAYLDRRGRIADLLKIGKLSRPDILWDDVLGKE